MPIRNHVARATILRKGGVHVKSKASYRKKVKKIIKQEISDWQSRKRSDKIWENGKFDYGKGLPLFIFHPIYFLAYSGI